MKNITVSVDEETYRISRIRAAEAGTSVSALVRGYLRSLVRERTGERVAEGPDAETEFQRRRRLISEVLEAIHARGGGLHMADNLPRKALYDRNAFR